MKFTVAVTSDTVCPWCYVGAKRLDNAISMYKSKYPNADDTFSITWLPFYLQPDAPNVSISKQDYYVEKFGEYRTTMMHKRLSAIGKDVGIDFKYGGRTGNTRTSHRLIQLGLGKGGGELQTKVVQELFKAYFENEQDITSKDVLTTAGVKAGLEEDEVKAWLDSDDGGVEVDRFVADARNRGVEGVPDFVLNEKYQIGGAQESEAFLEVFEALKNNEGKTNGA
jgi:predicted DsbA family dithiol-disulfide isomerase